MLTVIPDGAQRFKHIATRSPEELLRVIIDAIHANPDALHLKIITGTPASNEAYYYCRKILWPSHWRLDRGKPAQNYLDTDGAVARIHCLLLRASTPHS